MAQADFLVGDIYANTHKVLQTCEYARDTQGADLIVFPELTLTGYPPEDLLFRPHFIEHVEAAVDFLRQQITGIAASGRRHYCLSQAAFTQLRCVR
jgi:NAD+ synthase (glutamine-hydrolysing)